MLYQRVSHLTQQYCLQPKKETNEETISPFRYDFITANNHAVGTKGNKQILACIVKGSFF